MHSFLPPYTLGALVWTASMSFTGCVAEPSGNAPGRGGAGKGDVDTTKCPETPASVLGKVQEYRSKSTWDGKRVSTSDLADLITTEIQNEFDNRRVDDIQRHWRCLGKSLEELARDHAPLRDYVDAVLAYGANARMRVGGTHCPEHIDITVDRFEEADIALHSEGVPLPWSRHEAHQPDMEPPPAPGTAIRTYMCPAGLINRPLGVLTARKLVIGPEEIPTHCFCGPPGITLGSSDDGLLGADSTASCGELCEDDIDCAQMEPITKQLWTAAAFGTILWLNKIEGTRAAYPKLTFYEVFNREIASTRTREAILSEPPIPPHRQVPPYICAKSTATKLGMCVKAGQPGAWHNCQARYGTFYDSTPERTAAIRTALNQAGIPYGQYLPLR